MFSPFQKMKMSTLVGHFGLNPEYIYISIITFENKPIYMFSPFQKMKMSTLIGHFGFNPEYIYKY